MFGWFKKIYKNEGIKLYFQNKLALEDIGIYMDSSEYFKLAEYTGPFESIEQIDEINETIGGKVINGQTLTQDDRENLIAANRDLRTLFAYPPMQIHNQTFDVRYKPIVGWEEYYRRF